MDRRIGGVKLSNKQSFAGLVREKLELIEQRLEVGVRQDVILAELNRDGGHDTTLANFRDALFRARKWREKKLSSNTYSKPLLATRSRIETPRVKEPEIKSLNWQGTAKDEDVI